MDVFGSDSDCDSYTETSGSEDHDDNESTYGGHAQSILSSLDESIGKIDDFLAYERGFVHGDIVFSIADPSGQLGRIVDVDMIVDLETTYRESIKDVSSKNLLRLQSFVCGDYVVHGPWLGRVDRVLDVVTIMFDDGTRSQVMTGDTEILVPVPPILYEDAPYPYYPGQRVRFKHPTTSNSIRWLCGSSKTSQNEGTICQIEVGLVHVSWIASVMIDSYVIVTTSTPPHVQDPKNLKLLSCFTYANWQLGDWCTISSDYAHSPHMATENRTSSSFSPRYRTNIEKKFGICEPFYKKMYVITKTKTKVDVLWQNGSKSLGLDSQTLHPVNNLGDHDFWPGQFVLEKAISEDVHVSGGQKWGVVRNVDAQERTVTVIWKAEESDEDIVSAYELTEHPEFSYCIGDVVFRLYSEKLEENIVDLQSNGQNLRHELPYRGEFDHSAIFGKDTPMEKNIGESYLSCIGMVIGFKDESIEVRWASDLISEVHPSEIFGLNKLDDAPSVPAVQEEPVPEIVNKETADQENQSSLVKQKDANDSGEDCKKYTWNGSASLFSWAAIGYLTNVASNIFYSHGSTSFSGLWKGDYGHQILKAEELQSGVDELQLDSLNWQAKEVDLNEQIFPPGTSTVKFKSFDIVGDCSDHHFVNYLSKEVVLSQVKGSWLKKVQQEWSILEKDLPDSIFVRVYEERIDLLRACIVGAPGTPYHDGLFFFDIFFPPDYPQEPPLVHYNSGGLRLNPNLYESGKVCLSLLKTWVGTGTEVWNPTSSTTLQVLLSLQALVLNEKPYFNEAGYDEQIGRADGEKNSITYNENAFLLSCKSMLYILHKPPKHFEALVEEHFGHRSHHILDACKAYVDGAPVGWAFEHGKSPSGARQSCSTGFKIMLAKILPKMVAGFSERGIDCSQFLGKKDQITVTGVGVISD